MLAHMSFRSLPEEEREIARRKERELALFSIDIVRRNGGIIEHPSGSRLFKGGHGATLPDVGDLTDEYGGFTIAFDQFDFGHVASKPTKLYICGYPRNHPLPQLPQANTSIPTRSVTGFTIKVHGKYVKRCTLKEREHTPAALIDWIEEVLTRIGEGI